MGHLGTGGSVDILLNQVEKRLAESQNVTLVQFSSRKAPRMSLCGIYYSEKRK